MLSSDAMRGHLDAILLCLIQEKDRYGYELFSEVGARTGGRLTIKEATLYAALQRLERQSHISSYQGEVSGGSKRRYYHLTESGRAFLAELTAGWQEMKEILDIFLLPHEPKKKRSFLSLRKDEDKK